MVDIFFNFGTSASATLDSVCEDYLVTVVSNGTLFFNFLSGRLFSFSFTNRYPKRTVVCHF
jgi:hypothetical protein